MYLLENPVLQRELLVNLRMSRAFLLLLVYQTLLGTVVFVAWPQDERLDLTNATDEKAARELVDLFFLGQYLIASLMAPSFAAGAISGEKERKTYEMLLASPLRPPAILLGKLLASLAHLAILIFASLPIVMLCLPLGGVSLYEVLAAYLALILSVTTFGMISIACSSFFQRTSAALVVSYLLILPLALAGVLFWNLFANLGEFRLWVAVIVLPLGLGAICVGLFATTSLRLLHPPDVGSEGKEVVDIDLEAQQAVGLVIQRDQFPDRLFAPPKRTDFLPDGANPVYEKEIRSEIFSQGTLMLRLVIQVSMFLAIPLMAVCLYMWPQFAAWYIGYVVLFNILVGPVFSAGSVTNERERETLDLLLCTMITPFQILWGKLIAGLRISTVLTSFLLWPVLLACLMVNFYWNNFGAVGAYLLIVALSCLTTAVLALFFSVNFRKTSQSMMTSYAAIIAMYFVPLAVGFFAAMFFPNMADRATLTLIQRMTAADKSEEEIARQLQSSQLPILARGHNQWTPALVRQAGERARATRWVQLLGMTSPFSAAAAVPLDADLAEGQSSNQGDWSLVWAYVGFTLLLNLFLLGNMIWLFNARWRVSQ